MREEIRQGRVSGYLVTKTMNDDLRAEWIHDRHSLKQPMIWIELDPSGRRANITWLPASFGFIEPLIPRYRAVVRDISEYAEAVARKHAAPSKITFDYGCIARLPADVATSLARAILARVHRPINPERDTGEEAA